MQCILYKIYFWKVFHMNYNWICTPICTKILFLQKVGVTRTHYQGNGGVSLAGRKVTLPTSVPIRAIVLLWQLRPLLCLPMGQILFLLLLGRTSFMERLIMSQLRNPRKLRTWSSVHFPSMTSLQLCCLILEHHILSYLLHMLRSIIYPWPC
jgi:hypothetical protein